MIGDQLHLYGFIIGCELAFWLVLGAALVVRYVYQRKAASKRLLLALPVVDLLLLASTAADLSAGTRATFAHGLAVAYLGFTVAFGPLIVRSMDAWFSFLYARGARPEQPARIGWKAVADDLKLWFRCIVAWAITVVLLGIIISVIADDAITQPLHVWYRIAIGSIAIWFLLGPLWSVVFLSWRRHRA